MAKFVPPIIQDNPDGWGPCTLPEQFKDMPYQPFSKGDRLGKVLRVNYKEYQHISYIIGFLNRLLTGMDQLIRTGVF